MHVIVRVLIVRGRETFEIGEGLGTEKCSQLCTMGKAWEPRLMYLHVCSLAQDALHQTIGSVFICDIYHKYIIVLFLQYTRVV